MAKNNLAPLPMNKFGKIVTVVLMTTSLQADNEALKDHVVDIDSTTNATAKLNKAFLIAVDDESIQFDENETATIDKLDEEIGGIISDNNDKMKNISDILEAGGKSVYLSGDEIFKIQIKDMRDINSSNSDSDTTLSLLEDRVNNFFHFRENQEQGEAVQQGWENMNKIKKSKNFIPVIPCPEREQVIQGTNECQQVVEKSFEQWSDDSCQPGWASTQGQINSCDIPVNIPATFTGDLTGEITEGDMPISGKIDVTDPDIGEALIIVQTNSEGTYGSFSIDENGNWTYNMTAEMEPGEEQTDTFTITTGGGNQEDITITVMGDGPELP